jgi:hypothetical protein
MNGIGEYITKHSIILFKAYIDIETAEATGVPVPDEHGELAAYYIEDGYMAHNCFMGRSKENAQSTMNKIAYTVAYLNPDKEVDVLFNYLDMLATDRYDSGEEKISRPYLLSCLKKKVDPYKESRKFYWVGRFQHAKLEDKKKIFRSFLNNTAEVKNVKAVASYMHEMEESSRFFFITARSISDATGLGYWTVINILPQFRERIDNYNVSVCSTDNFSHFRKIVNIDKIVSVIDNYVESGDLSGITKSRVSSKAGISRVTVHKLWDEESIEMACSRYNAWLGETLKIAG